MNKNYSASNLAQEKILNDKTCPHCKQRYTPIRSFQKHCLETACIEKGNEKLREAKRKVNRKALKQFNDSDKTILKAKAQAIVNKYARLRDEKERGRVCCTCHHSEKGQFDGGHFLPTSGYSAIRYNTNQIFLQCKKCNRFNGGMPKEYREFMVSRYGEEYVVKLESTKNQLRSYSVEYYKKLISVVRKKIKRLEIK